MIEAIPTLVTLIVLGTVFLIAIMLAGKYLPSGWLRHSLEDDKTIKHALLVQIQPERVKGFNGPRAGRELVKNAKCRGIGFAFQINQGNDNGEYINVSFETKHIKSLWAILGKQILNDDSLSNCVIATCTGKDGWNDYLQLHHYDKGEKLDTL